MSGEGNPIGDRKSRILKAVIDEYIETGEPVGSKYIAAKHVPEFSSATIRNEMAELEALGYLEQPHTSAGRVPSGRGYRLYVNSLMRVYSLSDDERQTVDSAIPPEGEELETLLERGCAIISELTRMTAIAMISCGERHAVILKFQTVRIDDRNFLLVIVTDLHMVKTKNIRADFEVSDVFLERLTDTLNTGMAGKPIESMNAADVLVMEQKMGDFAGSVRPVLNVICRAISREAEDKLHIEGLSNLFAYPEYRDMERTRGVMATLERKDELLRAIWSAQRERTNVLIGPESEVSSFEDSSLVFQPFEQDGKTLGAVGIIGPMRMNYPRIIANLDYLSQAVKKLFGNSGNGKK